MIWTLLLLGAGLALLWKGADLLSDGAVGLAERMGVSKLVVGLTVVAMGTSAPEVAAGIVAALAGQGDIVLGNVFGANIANLAWIAGMVALIRPLQIRATTLRRQIPAMLVVVLLLWPVLADRRLSRIDGVILLAVLVGLLLHTIHQARGDVAPSTFDELRTVAHPARTVNRDVFLMILGLGGLTVGARLAVYSAESIGARLGLSDAVIGSTILAIGTTLPELMTCVVAAVKGHHDISVGNLVGSVVFNALLVTGAAALTRPLTVSSRLAAGLDYWIMVGVCVIFAFLVLLGKRTIRRTYGAFLVAVYACYLIYLLRTPGAA